jgi:hypothetical protein
MDLKYTGFVRVGRIQLVQERWALENTIMNLRVAIKEEEFVKQLSDYQLHKIKSARWI